MFFHWHITGKNSFSPPKKALPKVVFCHHIFTSRNTHKNTEILQGMEYSSTTSTPFHLVWGACASSFLNMFVYACARGIEKERFANNSGAYELNQKQCSSSIIINAIIRKQFFVPAYIKDIASIPASAFFFEGFFCIGFTDTHVFNVCYQPFCGIQSHRFITGFQ